MDIQAELKAFKTRLDPKIAAYFDARIAEARAEDALVAEALTHVKAMVLAGGKRLRPAFVCHGYRAAGGTDEARIVDTSLAIELIHTFLLIHDDIIDRDAKRHGVATLHSRYAKWGEKFLGLKDAGHFGNSIALIVGDMLFALGNDVIFQSGFPTERIFAALSKVQRIITHTVIGEASDVYIEYKGSATLPEVLRMYENKTSRYTFEGPLHLGAILGGAETNLLSDLSQYALPLGIAFQIQDDILGIFGTEERIGKPVGSDIHEGKITPLVVLALQHGGESARTIASILKLGEHLTPADIERFRTTLRESGALGEAQRLARDYISQAITALNSSSRLDGAAQAFLTGVAQYMIEREY